MSINKITQWYPVTVTPAQVKPGTSSDRDPQQGGGGYQKQPEPKEPERPLTEEEFSECLKRLTVMPGYVQANFSHRVEKNSDGERVVVLLDAQQAIVRRFTESQLAAAFLLQEKNEDRGGLIDKKV
jgi:hypothetical protein